MSSANNDAANYRDGCREVVIFVLFHPAADAAGSPVLIITKILPIRPDVLTHRAASVQGALVIDGRTRLSLRSDAAVSIACIYHALKTTRPGEPTASAVGCYRANADE